MMKNISKGFSRARLAHLRHSSPGHLAKKVPGALVVACPDPGRAGNVKGV